MIILSATCQLFWQVSLNKCLYSRWTWWWTWKVVTCWQRRQIAGSLWACWRRCCWLMQKRGLPPQKLSAIHLWRCSTCLIFHIATSELPLLHIVGLVQFWPSYIPVTCTPHVSVFSVKSCFHIMDVCWTRPSAYEAANRNKGPFIRPVTTTAAASANHPFSKMTAVHPQVSWFWFFLHKVIIASRN